MNEFLYPLEKNQCGPLSDRPNHAYVNPLLGTGHRLEVRTGGNELPVIHCSLSFLMMKSVDHPQNR
jgi:hypothetical protein